MSKFFCHVFRCILGTFLALLPLMQLWAKNIISTFSSVFTYVRLYKLPLKYPPFLLLLGICRLHSSKTMWPECPTSVSSQTLWPLATTNFGGLWPRIVSLCLLKCYELRPQRTVVIFGRESMFYEVRRYNLVTLSEDSRGILNM